MFSPKANEKSKQKGTMIYKIPLSVAAIFKIGLFLFLYNSATNRRHTRGIAKRRSFKGI